MTTDHEVVGELIGDRDRESSRLTKEQRAALDRLCQNYGVEFDESKYTPQFDLPPGWVAGWVGPIYVGCDPEGHISS